MCLCMPIVHNLHTSKYDGRGRQGPRRQGTSLQTIPPYSTPRRNTNVCLPVVLYFRRKADEESVPYDSEGMGLIQPCKFYQRLVGGIAHMIKIHLDSFACSYTVGTVSRRCLWCPLMSHRVHKNDAEATPNHEYYSSIT